MKINKQILVFIFIVSTIIVSININNNNVKSIKTNILENNDVKEKYEKKLILKDEKITEIEKESEKEIEKLVQHKKEIIDEFLGEDNKTIKPYLKEVISLKQDIDKIKEDLDYIELNNCGLLKNITSKHFDKEALCEKEKIKKTGLGFTEDGKKLKVKLTRYFTPEHSQLYFKNTWKNGRATFGGKLYPQNEKERWNYFTADGTMQCGTRWKSYTTDKTKKKKLINEIEDACLVPGITPFITMDSNKETNKLQEKDAMKVIACDYSYIAEIANLGCNPKIYNSTPKSEWAERIECRKKLNKEVTIDIKGLGKVKCLDSGGMINQAHFDIWAGIGTNALKNLEQEQVGTIVKEDYYYDINGKKLSNPKNGLYAEIDIYKNDIKVY